MILCQFFCVDSVPCRQNLNLLWKKKFTFGNFGLQGKTTSSPTSSHLPKLLRSDFSAWRSNVQGGRPQGEPDFIESDEV